MSLTIRPARREDAALIVDFVRALADYERLPQEAVLTVAGVERTLFGDRPYAECLIADWDGAPAGFALFFHNYSTFLAKPGLHLEDLFVKPEHRGRGIGLALLRRLASIALERDCGRMEWSVLDWNEPSIRFYRQLGAVPMDEWTTYRLTRDAMEKLATPAP